MQFGQLKLDHDDVCAGTDIVDIPGTLVVNLSDFYYPIRL